MLPLSARIQRVRLAAATTPTASTVGAGTRGPLVRAEPLAPPLVAESRPAGPPSSPDSRARDLLGPLAIYAEADLVDMLMFYVGQSATPPELFPPRKGANRFKPKATQSKSPTAARATRTAKRRRSARKTL